MILLDTNVLVALALPKERLHERATRDLEKLVKHDLHVLSVVLTEACFLLVSKEARARLSELLAALRVRQATEPSFARVFEWMGRYADHEPDFVDACLVVLAGRDQRVWTYDEEFRTVWRRLDGSRVPLAVGKV